MKPLDVIKDIGPGLDPGPVLPPVAALPFQQSEEALHRGIVNTAVHSTHAADQVMAFQEALIFAAGEPAIADAFMFVNW